MLTKRKIMLSALVILLLVFVFSCATRISKESTPAVKNEIYLPGFTYHEGRALKPPDAKIIDSLHLNAEKNSDEFVKLFTMHHQGDLEFNKNEIKSFPIRLKGPSIIHIKFDVNDLNNKSFELLLIQKKTNEVLWEDKMYWQINDDIPKTERIEINKLMGKENSLWILKVKNLSRESTSIELLVGSVDITN